MKRTSRLVSVVLAAAFAMGMSGQSATNGVYGGYVGSDRWFSVMRSSAQNQAVMQSLARTRDPQQLPADYVEFAGQITFPDGAENPFPGKRFPDLRIVSRDKAADNVERGPFIDEDGGFYTVFKRGQTYDVFWMYYFGSREQFASITIPAEAPRQLRQAILYKPAANTAASPAASEPARTPQPAAQASKPPAPADANKFDMSGVPRTPTTFEEQQLLEIAREDGTSWYSHQKLAGYYEKKGDQKRADAEYEKAKYWKNPSAYGPPANATPSLVPPASPGSSPRTDTPPKSDVDTPPRAISMPDRATSVAVVIGISQYREKDIPQLPFAKHDSETIAAYLQNVAGIRRENIKMLSDSGATRSDIEETVEEWLPRHTVDTSDVIFYYAGHGALDPATGDTYLVPHEGHPESPATRMYPLKRLYDKLEGLPAKNVTVLLDSCFSGGGRSIAVRGRPIVITSDRVTVNSGKLTILSAASANQISSDLDRTGHGLFTYFLLKGMRGEADTSRDGWIDLYELFNFVKTNVNSTAVSELNREQTPTLLGGADAEPRSKNLKLFRVSR